MEAKQKREIRRQFNVALREREHTSKDICAKIRASTGRARYDAWDEKRSYGSNTRWIHLAYGFLKGLPYAAIEAKTGENNNAYPQAIVGAAKDVTGLDLNGEAIMTWLIGEPLAPEVSKLEVRIPLKVETPKPAPVAAVPVEPKPGFLARLFGRAAS